MRKSLVGIGLLLFSLTPAFGQLGELSLSFGASTIGSKTIGELAPGVPADLENGFRFAFRITLNTFSFFGHEFGYSLSRTGLDFGQQGDFRFNAHTGFYNFLLYATPEGSPFRPFATGGVHFTNFVPPGASALSGGGDNEFGVNYGAGLKVRLFSFWGLRFDFREYLTGKPFELPNSSGMLRHREISAGLAILF